MGKDPDRDPPFFFMKPSDSLVPSGATISYPPRTENYHFETELVVAIGTEGADIPVDEAENHVFGYAAGLDMTRRDLQLAARDSGRPWDMGKGADQSAPIGTIHPRAETGALSSGKIELKVNGDIKQSSDLQKLIWSVPEIVSDLSGYVRLMPGDLIYTGTPEGVGAIKSGDRLEVTIEGLSPLVVEIG
jgi:fumarylpyruvate hydrolase